MLDPSSPWQRGAMASCLLLGLLSEAPVKTTVFRASCGRLATQRVVAQALVPGAGVGLAAVGANVAAVAAAVAAVAAAAGLCKRSARICNWKELGRDWRRVAVWRGRGRCN